MEDPARLNRRYKSFYWLMMTAIVLNVAPAVFLQIPILVNRGFSNPFGAAWAFVYVPLSFIFWQAGLLFLYSTGKAVIAQHLREIIVLNVLYLALLILSAWIIFLAPVRFY